MARKNHLAQRVLRTVSRHRMMQAGDRAGVAVSGGADSVALLRLLLELQAELGVRFAVLHFNHQLRGDESDQDERFVAALAARHGLEFISGRNDVAGVARARGWNLEDAARRLRYGFFSSAAVKNALACVAVAHTADDQAETVLARLARGTGPAGLAAIYPVKELAFAEPNGADVVGTSQRIVRPLLEIRRGELREFLRQAGQSWREDASNRDTSRLRARLRHEILPMLESRVQPGIVGHLNRLAQLSREDEAFWSALVSERLAALVRRDTPGVGIRCADLLDPLPSLQGAAGHAGRERTAIALTRRLVRALAGQLPGKRPQVTAQHVAQVVRLAEARQAGRRVQLPGLVVERSYDWLWFSPAAGSGVKPSSGRLDSSHFQPAAAEFSYSVELRPAGEPTLIAVPEINKCFRLKVIDWPSVERDTSYAKGLLDRDLLGAPLILRSWRPGDAFRPFGRHGVRKLKHFLQVRRVAPRDRIGWPVLTSAGSLVWARGLPVAAEFAPGQTTRAGVMVVEEEL